MDTQQKNEILEEVADGADPQLIREAASAHGDSAPKVATALKQPFSRADLEYRAEVLRAAQDELSERRFEQLLQAGSPGYERERPFQQAWAWWYEVEEDLIHFISMDLTVESWPADETQAEQYEGQ